MPIPVTARDRAGCLDSDLPCICCGYSLRSLADDGNCPECGVPVAHSVDRNRLLMADIDALAAARAGATCLAIAAFLRAPLPLAVVIPLVALCQPIVEPLWLAGAWLAY